MNERILYSEQDLLVMREINERIEYVLTQVESDRRRRMINGVQDLRHASTYHLFNEHKPIVSHQHFIMWKNGKMTICSVMSTFEIELPARIERIYEIARSIQDYDDMQRVMDS